MRMRLGKARKSCGFMMEALEQRQMLSATVDDLTSAEPALPAIAESLEFTPASAPGAPTGLASTAILSSIVELSWNDESSNEAGFRVERSVDGIDYLTVGTLSPNVTFFHDAHLNPATTYFYRVQAFDDLGASTASDSLQVSTLAQGLSTIFNENGLNQLSYNGVTLVDTTLNPKDSFWVGQYKIIKPDGTIITSASSVYSYTFDAVTHSLTYTYPWARFTTQYVQEADTLKVIVTVQNRSSKNTLAGVNLYPLSLRFPTFPDGYNATSPHIGSNLEGPTVIPADWGNGMLVAANEDVSKPLYSGLFSDPTTATTHRYALWIGSTPLSFQPDNWPKFDRPIAPGASDQYVITLRFAPSATSPALLAYDIYSAAAAKYPFQLNWSDRRPIGAIHIASDGPSRTKTNPRGFLFNPTIDVTTKRGLIRFRQLLLAAADQSISVLKGMNAQGMVVWNVEGEEYRRISYVGDPRKIGIFAPEMEFNSAIDAYFQKFRDAGLRVGVTVRAQKLVLTSKGWRQTEPPNPYSLLASKIAYAHNRWGATLFYIDSNTHVGNGTIYSPSLMKKLADAFPDCLIIPEHETTRYYAYTAPYSELRMGEQSTPESALEAYPGAFGVINTMGGDLVTAHDTLVDSVRHGDILMFCGWYDDASNLLVKSIYDEAFGTTP